MEDVFRRAFDHAPVGMAIVADGGRLEQVNPALCRMMGRAASELAGSNVDAFAPPGVDLEFDEPTNQLIRGELDVWRGERRLWHSEGRPIWVDISVSLSQRSEGGPITFLAQVLDITERRQIEDQLRFRISMEELVASITSGLITVDPDSLEHEIDHALGRLAVLMGAERAYVLSMRGSLAGARYVEWCAPGIDRAAADIETLEPDTARWWQHLLEAGEPVAITDVRAAADRPLGVSRRLERDDVQSMLVVPLRTRVRSSGFIGLVTVTHQREFDTDLTGLLRVAGESFLFAYERADTHAALLDAKAELEYRNDELERSNIELERFAYAAAHDLKAPLARIEMALRALPTSGAELTDDAGMLVEVAQRGSERLRKLIEDLLAYAAIGRGTNQPEAVDLGSVVDQALADLAGPIAASDATVEVAEGLPTVMGQRSLLGLLVQNLVSNAVKFAKPGAPPRVAIDAERLDRGWVLRVTDDGIGIDPERRDDVFGMFTRLQSDDVYAGSGIGLATCAKVVTIHGGRIWVDAAPRGGTRMCVLFPSAA